MPEEPRGESSPEAISRLLQAWRGEIEAGRVYEILAQRQADSNRADILRRMSAAEGRHRARIEQRLEELGVPIPNPDSVQLSHWQQLQLRLAPIDKVLARQEVAEETEITDRYKRPTGDPATDALLADIRHEESQHDLQVRQMRGNGPAEPASGPRATLRQMMSRERGHSTGSGWISGAIYGANDGLAAVFGIVAGVSGATGGSHVVLLSGLFGAIASALSMAVGALLAERSEGEVQHANLARERQEIEDHPDEEREEVALFYQLKGLSASDAGAVAEKLAESPQALLSVLAAEELGITESGGGNPVRAAFAAGISTMLGAIIPVLPFFWLEGTIAVAIAAAVSIAAHFLVGAAKSLVTLRTWWSAGLEMTLAGVVVGSVTYIIGVLLPHL